MSIGTRRAQSADRRPRDGFLSRELATIMRDLDIQLDLESCVGQDFELKPVDDVFSALEFRTLRDRLHKVYGGLHGEEIETGIVNAHEVVETIIVRDEAQLQESGR